MALHAARMFHEFLPLGGPALLNGPAPQTGPAALLIDGDNISPRHAEALLAAAPRPQVARLYADTPHAKPWEGIHALDLRQTGPGKNAADILLALDALELALARGYRHFTLASSDGDFSHLARRLREHHCTVTGLGEAKAPASFRNACTHFHLLPACPAPTGPQDPDATLNLKIRALIKAGSTGASGIPVAQLGAQMFQRHGLRARDLSDRSWPAYLTARPALYTITNPGPDAIVRYHPEAFRALTAQ
ncbi:NYN domain-containing protein [Oceanicola sp. 502str15]|uniref:NYN domain-containing protein n=1 Tax=Oceanicola sp. 502str15 TaxID=2696061 RepID=UPI002094046B|nr:NYN domain-containing protein [Oceanicola sp. 502str15]MCO6384505.1 NYN domain-containing protein [Oceanicola sp. 502str15]